MKLGFREYLNLNDWTDQDGADKYVRGNNLSRQLPQNCLGLSFSTYAILSAGTNARGTTIFTSALADQFPRALNQLIVDFK